MSEINFYILSQKQAFLINSLINSKSIFIDWLVLSV